MLGKKTSNRGRNPLEPVLLQLALPWEITAPLPEGQWKLCALKDTLCRQRVALCRPRAASTARQTHFAGRIIWVVRPAKWVCRAVWLEMGNFPHYGDFEGPIGNFFLRGFPIQILGNFTQCRFCTKFNNKWYNLALKAHNEVNFQLMILYL